jgi:hypothetical protein
MVTLVRMNWPAPAPVALPVLAAPPLALPPAPCAPVAAIKQPVNVIWLLAPFWLPLNVPPVLPSVRVPLCVPLPDCVVLCAATIVVESAAARHVPITLRFNISILLW